MPHRMRFLRPSIGPTHHPVILVGHQPYIGQIAAKLLCGDSQLWTVKKGGMWWLRHRVRHGIPQTLLKAVMNPGLMAS